MFHITEPYPFVDTLWRRFCKHGWLGVPLFFVISGYCIATIASKETRVGAFLAGRFTRVYFPYWASLAVVLGMVAIRYLWTGTNDVTPLPRDSWSWLATLILVTHPASSVPTINWVYWSLTYEVAFYLIVALGLAFRCPTLVVASTTVLAAACVIFPVAQSFLSPLFFLRHFPVFALGWFLHEKGRSKLAPLMLAVALGVTGWSHSRAEVLTACAALALLSINISSGSIRALAWCGRFSYSLYLIHVPIGCYLLARNRTALTLDHPLTEVIHDLVVLALVSGIAWVFFRVIEQPAHEWGKRIAATIRTKRLPRISPALSGD